MGKEKKFRNKIVDAAAGVINWHDRVPVSYTHLDVYKRQIINDCYEQLFN